MAPSATNGDHVAALDEIKAPPGVVLPPKEIKAILEKTAGYVARNGGVFEGMSFASVLVRTIQLTTIDRIREKEKHNPKFSFLSNNDAYNAFYQWRLSEIKAGRTTAVAAGRAGEAPAEAEKPKGPPQPPDFHFSARMPNINAQDLEVVRLMALFVAKNGRQFMTTISQREAGNYQFDFLRPQHSLHNFFQKLIDQYTALLRAGGIDGEGGKLQQERIKELQANVNDKFNVLGRAKQRAEWFKFQDEEKAKKEEEIENEKMSLTGTISSSSKPSSSPKQTSNRTYHHQPRSQITTCASKKPSPAKTPTTTTMPPPPSQPTQMGPPPIPSPQPQYQQDVRMQNTDDDDDEEKQRIRERTEATQRAQQARADAKTGSTQMKIKENYEPRAALRARNKQNMVICPNCRQQMPVNELDEHMRIELLDPRWKEQKAKADSRYSTTNLSTQDVANNLKRLASQRSDLFDGVTGQPVSEEEQARRKRAEKSYDGTPVEKGDQRLNMMQNVNVEEQIRAIHQKFGDKK
ncbi:Splicing factor 3A subunit [Lachnellula hyalina]|uniref:Splicing factor 3A subunit n=1 Tax=Lachnellula hyalina TaxID=1316788 RepID=A0A8H8R6F7_9HELO|nr:Splicing factor 3A subunit [Lachnellula hyalina]TVY28876.1 Splicing factor 3A subunit [Lachnellula hyalina]